MDKAAICAADLLGCAAISSDAVEILSPGTGAAFWRRRARFTAGNALLVSLEEVCKAEAICRARLYCFVKSPRAVSQSASSTAPGAESTSSSSSSSLVSYKLDRSSISPWSTSRSDMMATTKRKKLPIFPLWRRSPKRYTNLTTGPFHCYLRRQRLLRCISRTSGSPNPTWSSSKGCLGSSRSSIWRGITGKTSMGR